MPFGLVFRTPPLKMQHQFGANRIQKIAKSLTDMLAPLSEAATLSLDPVPTGSMSYQERIHQEDQIPMATDAALISYLVIQVHLSHTHRTCRSYLGSLCCAV